MNKVRRIKNEKYTVISNVFPTDSRLSLKAKGFLSLVMTLPEDWDFSINGICSVIPEGKTAVYSVINELVENGYCIVESNRSGNGKFGGNDYTFFEEPHSEKPYAGFPYTVKPNTENVTQQNNNKTKTIKETKTKNIKEKHIKENDLVLDFGETDEPECNTNVNNKNVKFSLLNELVLLGISRELAEDWCKVRKSKGGVNTKTAFNKIARELELAESMYGLTAEECITTCVENSWVGIKAEWFENRRNNERKPIERVDEKGRTLKEGEVMINGKIYR